MSNSFVAKGRRGGNLVFTTFHHAPHPSHSFLKRGRGGSWFLQLSIMHPIPVKPCGNQTWRINSQKQFSRNGNLRVSSLCVEGTYPIFVAKEDRRGWNGFSTLSQFISKSYEVTNKGRRFTSFTRVLHFEI